MAIRYVTLNGQIHEISTESLRGLGEWGWDISQDVISHSADIAALESSVGSSVIRIADSGKVQIYETEAGMTQSPRWRNVMPSDSIVNVKDYGALGDGVTDDTAAIQAAFDVLNSDISIEGTRLGGERSGIIFFPQGNYPVSSTLEIRHNTSRSISLLGEVLDQGGPTTPYSGTTCLKWVGGTGTNLRAKDWAALTHYAIVGDVVYWDNGNVYSLVTAGQAGSDGPKAGKPWVASTVYTVLGQRARLGANIYSLITAGTSGLTGPAGTGADITDGTAHWEYVSPHAAITDGTCVWQYLSNKLEYTLLRARGGNGMSIRNLTLSGEEKASRVLSILPWQTDQYAFQSGGQGHKIEYCQIANCAPNGITISIGNEDPLALGYDCAMLEFNSNSGSGCPNSNFPWSGYTEGGTFMKVWRGSNTKNIKVTGGIVSHCETVFDFGSDMYGANIDNVFSANISTFLKTAANNAITVRSCQTETGYYHSPFVTGGSGDTANSSCTVFEGCNFVGSLFLPDAWTAGIGTMSKANANTKTVTVTKTAHDLAVGMPIRILMQAGDEYSGAALNKFVSRDTWVTETPSANVFRYEDSYASSAAAYTNSATATITPIENRAIASVGGNLSLLGNFFGYSLATPAETLSDMQPALHCSVSGTGGLTSIGNNYSTLIDADVVDVFDGTTPSGGNAVTDIANSAAGYWQGVDSAVVSLNDKGRTSGGAAVSLRPLYGVAPTSLRLAPYYPGFPYGSTTQLANFSTPISGESRTATWKFTVPYNAITTAATTSAIRLAVLPGKVFVKAVMLEVPTLFTHSAGIITASVGQDASNRTKYLLSHRISGGATNLGIGVVSKATGATKVVTVTSVAHGLLTGNSVTVAFDAADTTDADELNNGSFVITSTPSADSFTYVDSEERSAGGPFTNGVAATFTPVATVVSGLQDSDLGTALARATAVQGGGFARYEYDGSDGCGIYLHLTSSSGNLYPNLSAGTLNVYVEAIVWR